MSKKELYSLLSYVKENLCRTSLKKILEKYAHRQNNEIQILIMELIEHLEQGNRFAEFIKNLNILPKYTINLLLYSEEMGQLQAGLAQVITYRRNRISQKRAIIHSFLYPTIIMIACITLFIIFLLYFVPLLISNFIELDIKLPKALTFLGTLSNIIKNNYLIIGPGFLAITTSSIYTLLFKQEELISLLSNIPILNKLTNYWDRYQLFLNLKLTLTNESQTNASIKNIKNVLQGKQSKKDLTKVQVLLFEGKNLSDAIKDTIFYTNEINMLLKDGEESEDLLGAVSNIENEMLENFNFYLGIIKKTSEPIIIIFIGSLVFSLLWLFMMPISSIMNNIGF